MQKDAGVPGVIETEFLETSCPKGQFYNQLRADLTLEQDAVSEEWRELSSTASPLGLFVLLYLDNYGGTTRIKALWEAGETLGHEDALELSLCTVQSWTNMLSHALKSGS